ncbi:hypothetical protein XaC1_477 [Xanthomonas phage XaC1]|nr:hypothetical protein XaC1_477 [Xanthomonas phage XaC1]
MYELKQRLDKLEYLKFYYAQTREPIFDTLEFFGELDLLGIEYEVLKDLFSTEQELYKLSESLYFEGSNLIDLLKGTGTVYHNGLDVTFSRTEDLFYMYRDSSSDVLYYYEAQSVMEEVLDYSTCDFNEIIYFYKIVKPLSEFNQSTDKTEVTRSFISFLLKNNTRTY